MNDQNETIKDAAVMLSRMTVEVGLLRAQLAAKTSEAERLREALQVGVEAILAQTSIACVIHMEESEKPCNKCVQCKRVAARRVMVAALAPRDEKPAGEGE